MNLSLGAKTSIGMIMLIVALLGAGIFTLTQREHQTKTRAVVIHTYEVLSKLQEVLVLVNDAETGQRGFLLTGDKFYLPPFNKAQEQLGPSIDTLEKLMESDPRQLERVVQLNSSVTAKLAELKETIELRRTKGLEPALKLVRSDRGMRLMDKIRGVITELSNAERAKLDERTRELHEVTGKASAASLSFLAASIFAVLLTGFLLRQFLTARERAEAKLAEQNKLTNFIAAVNKSLTEAASVDEVFHLCAKSMLEHSGADFVQIWSKLEGSDELRLRASVGAPAADSPKETFEADAARIAKGGKAELNQAISPSTKKSQHFASHPLLLQNKTLGVATLYSSSEFSQDFLTALGTASGTIALALERQRSGRDLKEREARTRAILDTAPDAIIIFDSEGNIDSANRAASTIFGWSREEIPGKNVRLLIPGFFDENIDQNNITTGGSKIFGAQQEYTGYRRDGTEVPVDFAWSVLNLGDRDIYTSVVRDITTRKLAESRLAVQYATAKAINESRSYTEVVNRVFKSVCGITGLVVGELWKLDESGTALTCSDIWYSPELAGSEFVQDSSSRRFASGEGLPGRVWQTKKPLWIEDLSKDDNFPRFPLAELIGLRSGFAFPIVLGDEFLGAIEFFSATLRRKDESLLDMMAAVGVQLGQFLQREQAQAEILRQRQLLELVLDTMSDGIVVANKSGNFVIVNPAAERLFGKLIDMSPSEWSNHFQLYELDQKTLFPPQELPLAKAIKGQESDDVEIYVRNATGDRFVSVSGRPIQGLFSGGMVVCRDVTERRAAEKRVSEFYSTVSHELRTPLTSIRGSLGLIEGGLAGQMPDKALKLVKIARTESDRLIRLINDILDIRKIEAGMFDLKKTIIEADALVHRTIEGIRGMAVDAGVTLKDNILSSGQVECDEDRMIQVITNLVSNAIKFSPKNSDVTIQLERTPDNCFRFSVIDRGPGIPKEQMHKLFGKFQQLDQTDSRKKGGTGLGLAITKAIVERHGGTIGVDSEPGQGSTFWCEIPAITRSAVKEEKELPRAHHPALVVEDDDNIAAILTEHLRNDGLEVVRAATLADARSLLAKLTPLVILLDLTLPDGSGLELMRELSASDAKRDIPVVVVTASNQAQNSYGHPALVDWITKPFQESRLHRALDLAKQELGPAHVLIVEDDPATRAVLREQLEMLGVRCVEAESGAQALERMREENPDLIILDLKIPPPNGFDVVNALKMDEFNSKPLIVYTASDLSEDEKAQLQLGLTAHLTKATTTPEQLINTVRQFLNGLLAGKPKDNN